MRALSSLPSPFDDPNWLRALGLRERSVLLEAIEAAGERVEPSPRAVTRWRRRPPFDDPETLRRRLDADDLDEERFTAAVSAPPALLARGLDRPPEWLAELAATYAGEGGAGRAPEAPERLSETGAPDEPEALLLGLVAPLLHRTRERLLEAVELLVRDHAGAPFEADAAVNLLLKPLPERLLRVIRRTVVLELNVARLQGDLEGETPEERFASFVSRIATRAGRTRLLAEYPVLARRLADEVLRHRRAGLEVLRHLCEDWPDLVATFGGGTASHRLVTLGSGAGDSHRGGRSVRVLAFDSGLSVVYKPRSLAVERHFQELLAWLNEHGARPRFRTLRVVDRGDRGWVERVEARPCRSLGQVRRFYRRQGGYLALLYVLHANDFHFENVIAEGEHPVLVDLESLFQRHLSAFDGTADGRASSLMAYSVVRTGLLPRRAWIGEDFTGIDLSALGAEEGQVMPNGPPVADDAGTDRMRLVRSQARLPAGSHRAILDGTPQLATDFAPELEAGFESVYRLLERHRGRLADPTGPIARFAGDEVRVIVQGTRVYALLLADADHPDLLRDGLDRSLHFERLWIGAKSQPERAALTLAEIEELEAGDVPHFTTRPRERGLLSGAGRTIPGFFEVTGLDLVNERLRLLGPTDLERQVWLVRACLAIARAPETSPRRTPARPATEAPSEGRLLALARRVGDRLEELALRGDGGEATWIGLAAQDETHFMPSPMGADLYGGLPGIALFLAYLGDATGERRYVSLAEAAWRTTEAQVAEHGQRIERVGAFSGWGGLLYAAAHLATLWSRPAVLEGTLAHRDRLPELIDKDRAFDVVAGAAGCLAALLAVHRAAPSADLLPLAELCGEHLRRHALSCGDGVGWTSDPERQPPLAGFSHGVAGIAWSLACLAQEAGDERHLTLANRALAYERGLYSPEEGNWRDLRTLLGPDGGFTLTWCHGAPGIGLARAHMLSGPVSPADRPMLVDEVARAATVTLDKGVGFSHCVCHGDLGNLETVRRAAAALGDEVLERRADRALAEVVASLETEGFRCGVPGGLETPALMDGLAGIGHALLRLARPDPVPSLLLLQPPPLRQGLRRGSSVPSEPVREELPA